MAPELVLPLVGIVRVETRQRRKFHEALPAVDEITDGDDLRRRASEEGRIELVDLSASVQDLADRREKNGVFGEQGVQVLVTPRIDELDVLFRGGQIGLPLALAEGGGKSNTSLVGWNTSAESLIER